MSTSEFLHLMIIFCILLRRNACILKQPSKTFQKSTFSSHLCSWVQDYGVLSLFPVRVVWCKGELKNWAPAVSGNERKWLQTPCGWDTGIMAHCQDWDPSRHFQLWKSVSSCGNWWKCSGESWGAEHHTPECWGWWSHQVTARPVIYKLQSQGLGHCCTGGLQQGRLLHMQSLCSRIIS